MDKNDQLQTPESVTGKSALFCLGRNGENKTKQWDQF